MNADGGLWTRSDNGVVLEVPTGAPSKLPTTPLKRGDVADKRIAPPAQQALVRLSTTAATRPVAMALLDHVRKGRLASIVCMNSDAARTRAKRLGSSETAAISTGEDAVVLLDPNDLRQGVPLLAFRAELDPSCGPPGRPPVAQPARLDAALVRALAGFEAWREGIQLGRLAKCALAPLDDPRRTVPASSLGTMQPFTTVLPRLLCQAKAVPAIPGTPRLVRHRHQPRDCHFTFEFKDDGGKLDLLPGNMNPRFILPNDTVSVHDPLQRKLEELLFRDFKSLLSPRTGAADRAPKAADRLRVALVDLTGKKLCQPQFAGYGETFRVAGGSTSKLLLIYAAHQLRFDLEQMVVIHRIKTEAELKTHTSREWAILRCPPDLKWLFDAKPRAGGLLEVKRTKELKDCLSDISSGAGSTARASQLLMRMGFEYVASVAWQSGLRHPQRGGIWYGGAYCQPGQPADFTPRCQSIANHPDCTESLKEQRAVWDADPLKVRAVEGTALAFATFMTLLAQGRLASEHMSREIERHLTNACSFVEPALGGSGIRGKKCADTSQLFHDAALVEREGRRWVVVFLSRGLRPEERPQVHELVRRIDQLIKENN